MFPSATIQEHTFVRAFEAFIHRRMSYLLSHWLGLAADEGICESENQTLLPVDLLLDLIGFLRA